MKLTRKRALGLIATLTLAIIAQRIYHFQSHPWIWSPRNTGEYSQPLIRPLVQYNPTKSPSRPWLDERRSTASLTTYHRYTASTLNGGQTDYVLYLPPGYDDPANAARRYPVVYWLHGQRSEPQYASPFIESLDAAIKSGIAPPMIVVVPNGLKSSWYVDSADGSQPVESVIIRDLIPHVDHTYRTIPDRRARALEGFSMGAWGAAHLAFKYPQLFCAATLISAPMHTLEQDLTLGRIFNFSRQNYFAEDPITRARVIAPQWKSDLRIRIRIGTQDNNYRLALSLDECLRKWGYDCNLIVLPWARHSDEEIYQRLGIADMAFYSRLFHPGP